MGKIVDKQFTWDEWVDRAESNGGLHVGTGVRVRFSGVDTFEEAIHLARNGWQIEQPDVEDILKQIETTIGDRQQNTFEGEFSVSGGAVDIGRFLSGEPECMIDLRPIKVMRTGRIIQLLVPVNIQGDVPKEYVINRGAACVALVDVLSRMQHPVEIWAGVNRYSANYSNDRVCYLVKVQDANQPLDIRRIMFALAHPAMPRVLSFANQEVEGKGVLRKMGGNNGMHPRHIHEEDLADHPDINIANAIVLPELGKMDRWTVADSVKWIEDQMKKIEEGAV